MSTNASAFISLSTNKWYDYFIRTISRKEPYINWDDSVYLFCHHNLEGKYLCDFPRGKICDISLCWTPRMYGAWQDGWRFTARVHWVNLSPARLFWRVLSASVNRLSRKKNVLVPKVDSGLYTDNVIWENARPERMNVCLTRCYKIYTDMRRCQAWENECMCDKML